MASYNNLYHLSVFTVDPGFSFNSEAFPIAGTGLTASMLV